MIYTQVNFYRHGAQFACVQTSPISFVARGKGTTTCNKGNRRRLHAGNAQSTMGARGFSCAVSGFGQVLKSDPRGIQEDLLLTVPGISNPCDLPGMRHRYGGDLLNKLQGRKE